MSKKVADPGEEKCPDCQPTHGRVRAQAFSFPRALPIKGKMESHPPCKSTQPDELLCSSKVKQYICGCKTGVLYIRIPGCIACQELRNASHPQPNCHPRKYYTHVPWVCDKCQKRTEDNPFEYPSGPKPRVLELSRVPLESPDLEFDSAPDSEDVAEPKLILSRPHKRLTLEMEDSGLFLRRRAKRAALKAEKGEVN